MNDYTQRFARQTRFNPLGEAGQARLQDSTVLLVGCGALGGILAQSLTRSGVGRLKLVDRDIVEESNLPRQILFEDRHVASHELKVDAAAETLRRIGGPTQLECFAEHLDASNIEELADDCDLILDGTDNMGTRYLVNDYAVDYEVPWIYGGVVGSGGLVLAVKPKQGPCLRCIFPEPPTAGSLPTCDTAGVLQPAVGAIASMQAGLALRSLCSPAELEPALLEVDVWDGVARSLVLKRAADCPCCVHEDFPFLNLPTAAPALILCGRNAVQIRGHAGRGRPAPDLENIAASLEGLASSLKHVGNILRFEVDDYCITLFSDGRALIEGTDDIDRALALYDRYVGA